MTHFDILILIGIILSILLLILIFQQSRHTTREQLQQLATYQQNQLEKLGQYLREQQNQDNIRLAQSQAQLRQEISAHIAHQNDHLHREIHHLANITEQRLQQIGNHMNSRLAHTDTSNQNTLKDIIARLAKIDEAQKRLDHLASDVTGLRDILTDKRSRGAFGETQLNMLIDNILPAQHISYQTTLSNGRRPDCLLLLPAPTGKLAIDAKFPLESYRQLLNGASPAQFKKDIKKHINDIAEKYICPPETAAGAILFLPAEAIFAEIHANHPELVEYAHHKHVWLTSPTTLAAILTTAKSAIKDDATRKQAHQLREQLYQLHQSFTAFQQQMDTLARHIEQAQRDVGDIHRTSKDISNRFHAIDQQSG